MTTLTATDCLKTTDSLLSASCQPIEATMMTGFFIAFIVGITAFRIWLAIRQIRHVSAHRKAVPAAFVDRITLSAHQKAADYACAKARFSIFDHVISALFLFWLTLGGGMNWLADSWAQLQTPSLFFQTVTLFGSVFLLTSLISALLDYYRVFHLESHFGFNRSGRRLWAVDQIRSALLFLSIELPLVLVAAWLMETATESWWLWLWLVLIAFNLSMAVIYPRVIAPMFNRFTPLDDPELTRRIQALLETNHFKTGGLYVMDGSRRSSHGNAYFSGFGSTKRIVFFDTLLELLSVDETVAVLAHELGHLKKHHIWQSLAGFSVISFIVLFGLYWLAGEPMFFLTLGVNWQTTPVILILFMQILPFVIFPLTPLLSLLSRKNEYEADAFAATQVPASDLISSLVKLFSENASTLTPDPVYSAVYSSHPTAADRVARLETPSP